MIEATCHCGAVKFEISHAPEWVNDCNCSICRRLGALWAYYNPSDVTLTTPGADIGGYVWGDRMLTFHHCRACGCTTHWSPIGQGDRMAVNARLMEPSVFSSLRIRQFDGATTWTHPGEAG